MNSYNCLEYLSAIFFQKAVCTEGVGCRISPVLLSTYGNSIGANRAMFVPLLVRVQDKIKTVRAFQIYSVEIKSKHSQEKEDKDYTTFCEWTDEFSSFPHLHKSTLEDEDYQKIVMWARNLSCSSSLWLHWNTNHQLQTWTIQHLCNPMHSSAL